MNSVQQIEFHNFDTRTQRMSATGEPIGSLLASVSCVSKSIDSPRKIRNKLKRKSARQF